MFVDAPGYDLSGIQTTACYHGIVVKGRTDACSTRQCVVRDSDIAGVSVNGNGYGIYYTTVGAGFPQRHQLVTNTKISNFSYGAYPYYQRDSMVTFEGVHFANSDRGISTFRKP